MEDQKQQLDTYQSELKLVNERNAEISRRLASKLIIHRKTSLYNEKLWV